MKTKPMRFYSCGICGSYHRETFDGDCRDNTERFSLGDLDAMLGPDGWQECKQPGTDLDELEEPQ